MLSHYQFASWAHPKPIKQTLQNTKKLPEVLNGDEGKRSSVPVSKLVSMWERQIIQKRPTRELPTTFEGR